MEIEVQDSRDNPLLEREEFHVVIDHPGEATPTKNEVLKRFAAENDFDLEKLEVDGIYTGFGGGRSEADIKAYEEKVRELTEDDLEEEPEEEEAEEVEQDTEEEAEEQEAEEETEEADEEPEQEEETQDEEESETEAEEEEEAEEQTEDEADEDKEE